MIPARRFHAGPTRRRMSRMRRMRRMSGHASGTRCTLQRLDQFKLAPGQRGRSALTVQLWWLVQGSLFRWSPQFAYGFRRWLLRLFGARRRQGADPAQRHRDLSWKVDIGEHAWIGDDAVIYSLGPVHRCARRGVAAQLPVRRRP